MLCVAMPAILRTNNKIHMQTPDVKNIFVSMVYQFYQLQHWTYDHNIAVQTLGT